MVTIFRQQKFDSFSAEIGNIFLICKLINTSPTYWKFSIGNTSWGSKQFSFPFSVKVGVSPETSEWPAFFSSSLQCISITANKFIEESLLLLRSRHLIVRTLICTMKRITNTSTSRGIVYEIQRTTQRRPKSFLPFVRTLKLIYNHFTELSLEHTSLKIAGSLRVPANYCQTFTSVVKSSGWEMSVNLGKQRRGSKEIVSTLRQTF